MSDDFSLIFFTVFAILMIAFFSSNNRPPRNP